jgi:hypothetical protein
MTIALVLLGLAAVFGLYMASIRLRGAERPATSVALTHGALAAAGLIALIVAVMSTTNPGMARTALMVLIVAALGGFFLFAMHLQKKALPIPVMVIHGLVAATGFIILILAVTQAV